MNGLDQEQCNYLLAALERTQDRLLGQLSGEQDVAPTTRPPPHEVEASPADNASTRTLNELVQEAAQHTTIQLRIVKHALLKFGDGSYGLCEHCGVAIGYSRLNAQPEARYCIVCQTRFERPRR
ncbi:TraR/DksA family transcriptional regulator [Rugamonas sp.]|uniref:TraR/DksA family transcriptional regulator n=1 Tax=Rugamonas sp. TaxID=1926287 RepID=UPI0025F4083A|nr:TraR/DksA family transcriptional regulator [Rugamonas sp.]